MRVRIAFWLFMITFLSAAAADYQLFYENGKAGLRDETGKVILPASFDALGWTDGSFSVVNQVTGYRKNSKWGLINLRKEFVTKPDFETLTSSGADRVIASKWINSFTKKFGCLDLAGNVVIPFHYDGITIRGLRAIVFVKNGARYEYGLIDLNNKSILPLRYRDIHPVGALRLAVQNFERKTSLFSDAGDQLTPFSIDSISTFRHGKAIVYQDFKQGVINREGIFEKEPQYREVRIANGGEVEARVFEEWKILSPANQPGSKTVADQLLPYGKEYVAVLANRFGLVTKQLETIRPFQFRSLQLVSNTLLVAQQEKFGLINKTGATILPFDFDSLSVDKNFVRALSRPYGAKVWSLYDTFGVKKSEKYYEAMSSFNGKFFEVKNYEFTGAMDRYGKEMLSCVYDSILDHNYAQVLVKFKGQYGVVDFNEKWTLTPQAKRIRLVNEQLYLEQNDSTTFLRKFGGEIIYFTNNMLTVRDQFLEEQTPQGEIKRISFEGMNTSANTSLEDTEKIFEESEGYRGIQRDGQFGFIDDRGRLRVANRYEGIGKFKEGVAPVKILGKWGFVNKDDKIVINPNYGYVSEFNGGVAIASRNHRFGLIDLNGKVLLDFRYDSLEVTGDQFKLVNGGKKGLVDRKGNVLIEPRFHDLELLPNGNVLVKIENHWGVLTLDGLSIIPTIYDDLIYDPAVDQYLAHQKTPWIKVN